MADLATVIIGREREPFRVSMHQPENGPSMVVVHARGLWSKNGRHLGLVVFEVFVPGQNMVA